jgi:hypothetical protein
MRDGGESFDIEPIVAYLRFQLPPMSKDDNPRVIDFSRDGAECPVETRIVVEETARGIRFIDPPGATGSAYTYL